MNQLNRQCASKALNSEHIHVFDAGRVKKVKIRALFGTLDAIVTIQVMNLG